MSKKNIIIGCIVIVLIVAGIILNNDKSVESITNQDKINLVENNSQIVIDIKGEVKIPGIYYIDSSSRVVDAINVAGGVTSFADIDGINLATKLEDGMIINVLKKEIQDIKTISINKATLDELTQIQGIGESKAKSIIEYRNKNGNFMSLEEIIKVDGITADLFSKIKELICL